MVLGKLTLAAASAVLGCGQIGGADAGVDGSLSDAPDSADVADAALDVTCDGLGTSKGVDSCCSDGTYCNGLCGKPGSCICTGISDLGGCPSSEVCCHNWQLAGCRLPDECKTCADVGNGPGIESCCSNGYCIGSCGTFQQSPYCYCGEIKGGCNQAQLCCLLSDGGATCIADASACP